MGHPGQMTEFPLRAPLAGATDGAAYGCQITFANRLDGTRSLSTSNTRTVYGVGYRTAFSSGVTADGPWSIRDKMGHIEACQYCYNLASWAAMHVVLGPPSA